MLRPQYPALPAMVSNAANLSRRGLWIVDVSNYVPGLLFPLEPLALSLSRPATGDTDICDGSPPANGGVCEFHAPRASIEYLQAVFHPAACKTKPRTRSKGVVL